MLLAAKQQVYHPTEAGRQSLRATEGKHLPRGCCHGSLLLLGGRVNAEAVHKPALGVLVQVNSVADSQLRLQEQTARTGTSRKCALTPLQQEPPSEQSSGYSSGCACHCTERSPGLNNS